MQKELLELELKYGPYEVDLPKDDELPSQQQEKPTQVQAEEEKVPEKRAAPEEIKETPIVTEAVASQQEEQKSGVPNAVYEAPIEDKKPA